jgi:hypothetical protein
MLRKILCYLSGWELKGGSDLALYLAAKVSTTPDNQPLKRRN